MRKLHWTLGLLAVLALVLAWFYYFLLLPYVSEATGFAAKTHCSGRYVSGRSALSILDEELNRPELSAIAVHEDRDRKLVTARINLTGVYGDDEDHSEDDMASTAVYRPGLGCTLVTGVDVLQLGIDLDDSPDIRALPPWQQALTELPTRPQAGAIAYVRKQFERDVGTRALLVWHGGALVAEQYAAGILNTTPLTSWSMSKSVVHALLGIAVREGWMGVEDDTLMPQWASDKRAKVSLDDLLRMSSGLRFDETYDLGHDVVSMLYNSWSASEYAAAMPLDFEPGSHWSYSSGTTNILARVLGDKVRAETGLSPAQFARQYLFDKLDTPSFTMEVDASGNLLGSSFAWATARDWMKFGVLYLYDGEFLGHRFFPEGWTGYAASFTPHSKGKYGAHFWTNHPDENTDERPMPSLPADTYFAGGFNGQNVVVIPSRDLVVVRLGFTPEPSDWDLDTHLPELLEALEGGAN